MITLNLEVFWLFFGSVAVAVAGFWGFKQLRKLF